MECYCDYDQPEWYREHVGTARKTHRCGECGSDIKPGEQYEYVAGKWEGDVSYHKTCERCLSFRIWMERNFKCFCWSLGNMLQDARDLADEKASDAVDEAPGVMFAAGRKYVSLMRRARADITARKIAKQTSLAG